MQSGNKVKIKEASPCTVSREVALSPPFSAFVRTLRTRPTDLPCPWALRRLRLTAWYVYAAISPPLRSSACGCFCNGILTVFVVILERHYKKLSIALSVKTFCSAPVSFTNTLFCLQNGIMHQHNRGPVFRFKNRFAFALRFSCQFCFPNDYTGTQSNRLPSVGGKN